MENKNNNIENNIFNELDDYDIKTTSNSILNAYYQKKETAKKKTKNKGLYITAGLTASLACALTIAICPEGIKKVSEEHPDVKVFVSTCDRGLNENCYILPGLGDAGDRLFGTK